MPPDSAHMVKFRVLVAPLDWGLGHATRCIPIIREFLNQGAEVVIAAETSTETVLRQEFPALLFLPLKGYRVRFAKSAAAFTGKIISQLSGMMRTIIHEHRWLDKVITDYQINAVISDNRYGLYTKKVPCVIITHQLAIKTGSSAGDYIARKMNYRFINRFTMCWVPDYADTSGLAGALSHPDNLPSVPVRYIGVLSRLAKIDTPSTPHHLYVSLSGPEPQRTLFEDKLVAQLSHYNHSATIVRGLPDAHRLLPSTNTLRFYNHLPAALVAAEMAKSDLVIARSGYSTIMDLVKTNKRAILVPTPGQSEQEYLAAWLMSKGFAFAVSQKDFILEKALEDAAQFFTSNQYLFAHRTNDDVLKEAVADIINGIHVVREIGKH